MVLNHTHFRSVIFSALFFSHRLPSSFRCSCTARRSVSVRPVTRRFSTVDGCTLSISLGLVRRIMSTSVRLNFFAMSFGRTLPLGVVSELSWASLVFLTCTGMCLLSFLSASTFAARFPSSHSLSLSSCSFIYSSVSISALLYFSMSCSSRKYSSLSFFWTSLSSCSTSLLPISPILLAISVTFALASSYGMSSAIDTPAHCNCFSNFFCLLSTSMSSFSTRSVSVVRFSSFNIFFMDKVRHDWAARVFLVDPVRNPSVSFGRGRTPLLRDEFRRGGGGGRDFSSAIAPRFTFEEEFRSSWISSSSCSIFFL
mmetsp:Transcript_24645/g.72071  ORF Transcript_24645/g.72071 Transcript_24645/m.72071 type:complete len:312 (-) Transcript_24645:371-1306(-)